MAMIYKPNAEALENEWDWGTIFDYNAIDTTKIYTVYFKNEKRRMEKMTKEKITQILNSHKEYLNGVGGCCANLIGADLIGADLRGAELRGADLRGADLSDADLRGADLSDADLSDADLRCADLSDADLRCADLRGADLRGAELRGADLIGTNIDFSCLPLWCGSLSAKFDDKQIKQFIYHIVKAGLSSPNVSDRIKSELEKLIPLSNEFHRAGECGIIEYKSP